jgi:hypothetical protein
MTTNPWTIIGWIILAVLAVLVSRALLLFCAAWIEGVYARWLNRRWWLKTRQAPLPTPNEPSFWRRKKGGVNFTVRNHHHCYSLVWGDGTEWDGLAAEDVRRFIQQYQMHCPAFFDK